MVSSSLVYVAHGAPRLLLLKPCGLRDYSHTPSLARGHLRQPKATDCGPRLSCTELRRCVVQRVSKFSQRNQVPDDDRLLSLFGWGAVAEGEEQEVRWETSLPSAGHNFATVGANQFTGRAASPSPSVR